MNEAVTPLTNAQRAHLRGLGQTLPDRVHLGRAGLTAEFLAELDRHLARDELVKLRFHGFDRSERTELLARVVTEGRCEAVGAVGQTALLYRQQPDPTRRVIAFG
jgi:RNA-binding protein